MRICLWSGPRNVSTALMYSFGQREDTLVVDEPLYAHYLRVSGVDHPGRERVLGHQDADGERVVRDVLLGPSPKPILFAKNMAHHLVDLDRSFLDATTNVLLTRDPLEVLPSLARKLGSGIDIADAGYDIQVELLEDLESAGQSVPVLEARELLNDPAGVLRSLCAMIDIPFEDDMLHWPAGPRPEDGVWADIWYRDVHMSTGFAPYRPRSTPFPDELRSLLEVCMPLYMKLADRTVKGCQ